MNKVCSHYVLCSLLLLKLPCVMHRLTTHTVESIVIELVEWCVMVELLYPYRKVLTALYYT